MVPVGGQVALSGMGRCRVRCGGSPRRERVGRTHAPQQQFLRRNARCLLYYRIPEPLYYPVIIVLIIPPRLEKTGGLLADSFRSFGEHSFGIYLIHPIIIAALAAAWASFTGLSWTDWVTYPVLFLATAAVSYGAVRLAAPLPYTGRLGGSSRFRRGPGRSGGT